MNENGSKGENYGRFGPTAAIPNNPSVMEPQFRIKTRFKLGAWLAMVSMSAGIFTPIPGSAAAPAWWLDGNPPVLTGGEENNLGPASIGQAKWVVSEALRALEFEDATAAATIRDLLTVPQPDPENPGQNVPAILDLTVPDPKPEGWAEKQMAPLLIGQLKSLSAPFYDVLHDQYPGWINGQLIAAQTKDLVDPENYYPWSSATTDDQNLAIATIGQLKAVFTLEFWLMDSNDRDADNLPDDWELLNGLDPNDDGSTDPSNGAAGDPDGDGLINELEYWHFADPNLADTDGDGLNDFDEVFVYFTYPDSGDTDYDGLDDYAEVFTYGTDPWDLDSDDDTLEDGDEVLSLGTNPLEMDTDGDLLSDGDEINLYFSDPTFADVDSDGDGLLDPFEVWLGLNLASTDSDNNGITDDLEDIDRDLLTNFAEFSVHLTNAKRFDTDFDTLNDGWEVANGFNPRVHNLDDDDPSNDPGADPDNDGLTNSEEETIGTKARDPDSDGDDVDDKTERDQGSNPNDPNDSAPPPTGTTSVNVTFGDDSGSHSEKYRLQLTPLEGDSTGHTERFRTNRDYGVSQTDTFQLPKGAKYRVELLHIDTNKSDSVPDYDHTLEIDTSQGCLVVDDPESIMGTSPQSGGTVFVIEGKSATLYVPLFEWITPKESPVTAPDDVGDGQNEFTYDTATPGVLTIDLKVLVKPTGTATLIGHDGVRFSDRCVFSLPAVGDSAFEWDEANLNGKSNASVDHLLGKATYTTLPSSNSAFGAKRAEFRCDGDGTILQEGEMEVFFPKFEKNHPLTGPYSPPDDRPPNWFYYWKEGGVCGIPTDAVYDHAASFGRVFPGTDRILRLGPDAPMANTGPETFHGPVPYGSLTVTGDGKGIKCVAETVVHELHHLTLYDLLAGRPESDTDMISDSDEAGLDGISSDPSNSDTYGMVSVDPGYAGYGDNEIRCRKMELTPGPYVPNLDWANPGCQSKAVYGP